MEPAEVRMCCGAIMCDYCYMEDKKCPTCGVTEEKMRKAIAAAREGGGDKAGDADVIAEMLNSTFDVGNVDECRSCLDPATQRPCCREMYCDKCYFKHGFCPNCQKPTVAGTDVSFGALFNPSARAIIWAYFVSCLIPVVAILVVLIAVVLEFSLPRTLFGYKCYGFNPPCDVEVCIDLGVDDPELGMQNPIRWQPCAVRSRNRVRGLACVYDAELYGMSRGELGYDFCVGSVASALGAEFRDGVYIFEDSFEHWNNETWEYKSPRCPAARASAARSGRRS